ncbi:uncharacterized protein MISP3 isoform X2 [Rhineura floridana]|uniref:uncharacterized protein MISP3 isoform X2 n=1 Tax=Rhineura floridana TaxID=261503 RepID=UPI002AC7F9BB|nr:uncharacterized protein MISP3 isoform X2 [Rhineura floridana]
MTTEDPSLPPPATGECHRGQESSEVDIFRDMVESRNMTKNVPITTTPDNSFIPSLDVAIGSLAKDNVLDESSTSVQKDNHFEKASLSPAMPPEGITRADVSNLPDQGQEDIHSVHQSKIPSPSTEQLNVDDTSSLLAQGKHGSHFECHGKIPDAFAEQQCHTGTSEQLAQGEEASQNHCYYKDLSGPIGSLKHLKLGQEEEGGALVHCRDTLDISSEQENSTSTSHQLGTREESGIVGSHGQAPASGSPEQPELASSPKQAVCNRENSQEECAAVVSPESPSILLLETNSSRHSWEGFPSHHSSSSTSAEYQGTFNAVGFNQEIKLGCQDSVETSKEEGIPTGQFFREGSVQNSQATEEQVAQDTKHIPAALSLALADPQPDVDTYCQQRAAGIGCDTSFQAVPTQSPVATSDSSGPAHWGLAPECDGQDRKGLTIQESSGAGKDDQPQSEVGAKAAALESKTTRDTGPEETTKEPESAKYLSGELPGLESLCGTRDPAGPKDPVSAMVLASAEEPLGARDRADSQDLASAAYPVAVSEHAGSNPKSRGELLLSARDPEDQVSSEDPVCATSISDDPSVTGSSGCPTDWMGYGTDNLETPHPTTETPIEREIRLHQEREELLRRERGLASPWGTQEYVEVHIRPILNQSVVSSMLPKEKERQWAGAQMHREIQRECQREEDLVQLGKVRGAYDRGTSQEMQEKKMIFEQHFSSEPLVPRKAACNSPGAMRGPSFAEANTAANVVILDSEALLQPQRAQAERTPAAANPFFCSRARSPQFLLEQEVQEAQEREWELQKQRYNLYGAALPCQAADQDKEIPTQPERPSCKKLDVTWPPPSPSEISQLERSPRILRRQRSALIQRWESGAVGNQESED